MEEGREAERDEGREGEGGKEAGNGCETNILLSFDFTMPYNISNSLSPLVNLWQILSTCKRITLGKYPNILLLLTFANSTHGLKSNAFNFSNVIASMEYSQGRRIHINVCTCPNKYQGM